jgi:hypothetical protein
MTGPKKPQKKFEMALFGWLFAGLVFWVSLVPAPAQSFVLEDPIRIDAQPEFEGLEGASPPCWPSTEDRQTGNIHLLNLVRLALVPAAASSLGGAIFRLKLIRLHPPAGPPRIFFAGAVTG